MRSELAAKATALAERCAHIDISMAGAARDRSAKANQNLDAAKRQADQRRRDAVADVRNTIAARRSSLRDRLSQMASDAAPGVFAAGFNQVWEVDESAMGAPDLIRRGVVGESAALYPLFHDRGWFLDGPPDETLDEIKTVILRTIAGLPIKHIRIDVFDPRIEGRLGVFSPLRSVHAATFPAPATSSGVFREALESGARLAADNAEAIATGHSRNLGELWRLNGSPTGEYRLIVVMNYPEGVDRETQRLLVRLARSGGPNGINLLVQSDPRALPAEDEVRAADLSQHLRSSRIETSGEVMLNEYPGTTTVVTDGAPPASLIEKVIAAASARVASDTGPIIPLAELIADDVATPWTGDSSSGLDATIARAGKRAVTINFRSQNPPVSNILIGGAVGQGKSNLLLDIIYALASKYSPDDLELHLLDFKSGLEFQRFAADADGRNWLPHAKVLSLESDKGFGVAVLRHVVSELARRSALFKAAGVSDIDGFRDAGKPLARLLLVIDEFHVMFDGDDILTDEAVELLERLARQGRASGVHLLLSSQTTSGVSGLRVKGESIFAQFPVRISLKNTVTESEAILSHGNRAAADLTYRGEIVVNRNFGHDPAGANERAVSAYAGDDFVSDLQVALWQKHPSGSPPLVFVSSDFARWPAVEPSLQPGRVPVGLIGRPVAVTDEPVMIEVDDDVDQAVAVVGSDGKLAVSVVASLVRSLGSSLGAERVVVIDLTAADDSLAGQTLSQTLGRLEEQGCEVLRFGRDESVVALTGLVRDSLLNGGPRTIVVGLGWQRWRDLDQSFPISPDDEYGTFRLGDLLQELVAHGALKNLFLVSWWTTLRSIDDQLGFRHDGIRHYVTTRLSVDDYRNLTSALTPSIEGYPRVGHIDRAADTGPTVAVPFDLEGVGP